MGTRLDDKLRNYLQGNAGGDKTIQQALSNSLPQQLVGEMNKGRQLNTLIMRTNKGQG